jgi:hypothetical protein
MTIMATSTSEGGVLQDLVFVDEVEQDHSDLEDQFVDEVCSGSNNVIVLTPPTFNKDAYAKKLALYPRHQCVNQSPESIKAIEDRDVFFQNVVNSRDITHLQGLSTIHHQAPREKPYLKGLGSMSAEARKAACKKGYKNGIAKGLEHKDDTWETRYAEFNEYDGIPGCKSALYIWQRVDWI